MVFLTFCIKDILHLWHVISNWNFWESATASSSYSNTFGYKVASGSVVIVHTL
jgi:hypothetical protein